MQQDRRGKKTANLGWQAWQRFCLKELSAKRHPPLNRSFSKWSETVMFKWRSRQTTSRLSHRPFAVLFFLPTCCVNSLLMESCDLEICRILINFCHFWNNSIVTIAQYLCILLAVLLSHVYCSSYISTFIARPNTTEAPTYSRIASNDPRFNVKLGVIIGCTISAFCVVVLVLFIIWRNPCRLVELLRYFQIPRSDWLHATNSDKTIVGFHVTSLQFKLKNYPS